MSRENDDLDIEVDEAASIPFTARLTAYSRAIEFQKDDALLRDPFAARLVGNLEEYMKQHKQVLRSSDYALIRSLFIEEEILTPWCSRHPRSQIIFPGAGLDTRAYRFSPFRNGKHSVYEIDFPLIVSYKSRLLEDESPLCPLKRISADLSKSGWVDFLQQGGFSKDLPTIWVLEGLAYYIPLDGFKKLLETIHQLGNDDTEIFLDVCVPAISEIQVGPFTPHFKWGLDFDKIQGFFLSLGWNTNASFADDYDHGRDVGQKGLIFVHGQRTDDRVDMAIENEIQNAFSGKVPRDVAESILSSFVDSIQQIYDDFQDDSDKLVHSYSTYIHRIKYAVMYLVNSLDSPISVGHLSSRLLGDPLSLISSWNDLSRQERESALVGNLIAILILAYTISNNIQPYRFKDSELDEQKSTIQRSGRMDSLLEFTRSLLT